MKLFFVFSFVLAVSLWSKATVLTVNNSTALPGNPGMYTTIQAAHDAAYPGDTILVHGSSTGYPSCTISKRITLIGPGFNPQSLTQHPATVIEIILSNGCSNTFIGGFYLQYITASSISVPTSNIVIRNNVVTGLPPYSAISVNSPFLSNVFIYNNIISCGIAVQGTNVVIANNIFKYYSVSSDISTLVIKNNLFLCANAVNFGLSNAEISNNIFYNYSPLGCNNCVFNNNLTYSCVDNNIPYGTNIGSGNIINQDPVFMSVPNCTFSYNNNYKPHITLSPCINAGIDGTNIGPSGGAYPFAYSVPITGMLPIPYIKELEITGPSSVPFGNNTIEVYIKAKK